MTSVQASRSALAALAAMVASSCVASHTAEGEFDTSLVASETLFDLRAPAAGDAVDSDTVPVELGVRFQASVAGKLRGVRFYRGAANPAGYTVHLWSASGGVLATATAVDGALPGWQEATFSAPVTIAKDTAFVASYFTSNGRYAGTNAGFATALTSGDLTAPAGAGVYHYGASGGFPADRFESSNYWVDVRFEPDATTPPPPPPSGCDRTASNAATLATAWNAATGGQTICLASGSYGTFKASSKPSVVTVRAQTGATATMELNFNGASNVRLDGLTITGGSLVNATRNITIANSTFTGALQIVNIANGNILLDHNTHQNINAPAGSTPARVHLAYGSATPSGVTIQRSLFAGGDADGVQTGVGVTLLDNEFRDILDNGPNHTDAIQLLGASGAVVRGNYIHNCASGIVAYDGIDHATIENNVIDLRGRPWGIELYSDDSSLVRHNTLRSGACDFNLPCGIISLNRKSADDAGRGTVVRDNIATQIDVENGSTLAAHDHNLLRTANGSGDVIGTPVFTGGAAPTSYAGFRLATGSPGRAAASDGTNIGIP